MARFYAEITGNRGTATRTGTANSGITAHIRGWDIGVEVRLSVGTDGEDEIGVWVTGGSNKPTTTHKTLNITKADVGDGIVHIQPLTYSCA